MAHDHDDHDIVSRDIGGGQVLRSIIVRPLMTVVSPLSSLCFRLLFDHFDPSPFDPVIPLSSAATAATQLCLHYSRSLSGGKMGKMGKIE